MNPRVASDHLGQLLNSWAKTHLWHIYILEINPFVLKWVLKRHFNSFAWPGRRQKTCLSDCLISSSNNCHLRQNNHLYEHQFTLIPLIPSDSLQQLWKLSETLVTYYYHHNANEFAALETRDARVQRLTTDNALPVWPLTITRLVIRQHYAPVCGPTAYQHGSSVGAQNAWTRPLIPGCDPDSTIAQTVLWHFERLETR